LNLTPVTVLASGFFTFLKFRLWVSEV